MLRFRHACAWTLLAVLAIGGTVAPDVHRVVHALEREALLAAHAADGHHGPETPGSHVRESCATRAVADAACALCQGTAAGVLLSASSAGKIASARTATPATAAHAETRRLEARKGRGPPEHVA